MKKCFNLYMVLFDISNLKISHFSKSLGQKTRNPISSFVWTIIMTVQIISQRWAMAHFKDFSLLSKEHTFKSLR